MAGILFCKPLPGKHMPQMTAAIVADNFDPATIRIRYPLYRAGYLIVKRRPPAAGIKFILRVIKWRLTSTADISAGLLIIGILARKRSFSALLHDDPLFLKGQLIPFSHFYTSCYFCKITNCLRKPTGYMVARKDKRTGGTFNSTNNKRMNQVTPFLPATPYRRIVAPTVLALILIASSIGCKKGGSSSSSGPTPVNGGALLTSEVLVASNSSGVTIDSIVTSYQYNGNNYLSTLQQTSTSSFSGDVIITSLTYNITYSGNLVSSLTGSYTESAQTPAQTVSSSTQISTTFQSAGGHVVSYIQTASTSGSPFIPLTPETASDSALLTYDANGNLSTYTIYEIEPGLTGYQLASQETYTYASGNLSQSVDIIYLSGIAVDTFTTAYQYNTKLSAAPLYIVPGVSVINLNDLTQSVVTETGDNPGTVTTAYTTTYNAANQPASSNATIATIPGNPNGIASEKITYTYQ